jgi:hypothetical protein
MYILVDIMTTNFYGFTKKIHKKRAYIFYSKMLNQRHNGGIMKLGQVSTWAISVNKKWLNQIVPKYSNQASRLAKTKTKTQKINAYL